MSATTYRLTLVWHGRLDDDQIDELFELADDITPERETGRTLLHFDRVASSEREALTSALSDARALGVTAGPWRLLSSP